MSAAGRYIPPERDCGKAGGTSKITGAVLTVETEVENG